MPLQRAELWVPALLSEHHFDVELETVASFICVVHESFHTELNHLFSLPRWGCCLRCHVPVSDEVIFFAHENKVCLIFTAFACPLLYVSLVKLLRKLFHFCLSRRLLVFISVDQYTS